MENSEEFPLNIYLCDCVPDTGTVSDVGGTLEQERLFHKQGYLGDIFTLLHGSSVKLRDVYLISTFIEMTRFPFSTHI